MSLLVRIGIVTGLRSLAVAYSALLVQAAADMSGKPIPGEHWLLVDLQQPVQPTSVEIDFETAFAEEYSLAVADAPGGPWTSAEGPRRHKSRQWLCVCGALTGNL